LGQLKDLSIVVTGASSGIGESIARRFWEEGARLTLGSRHEPENAGAGARWVRTDVSDPGAAQALIDAAVAENGRLDVLVNNAGVQIEKSIADTTDEEFDLVMDVNVKGVFNCARAAVRQMQQQGEGGSIINIGSIAGNTADHGMAVYNASKGAVHALTRAIATDHGRDGIRCNSIAPGWIATALADAAFDLADDPDAARNEAISKHPVGRLGLPEDIANLAVWLAGPESTFASGSVFTVDGGLTAQSPIG
jgi:meso-butanediol dehydrogenase/(S,S)-butanediol dehydrogenase/diacetyl reductase